MPRGQIGQAIYLENAASKGQSGRVIPLNDELRTALAEYAPTTGITSGNFLIESERSNRMSAQAIVNLFWRWYRHVGFDGCSSHSGRRTFITNIARKISTVGGSLRDVQMLAGHTNLRTTQRYIEANPEAQVRIVELV
jgi:integrase